MIRRSISELDRDLLIRKLVNEKRYDMQPYITAIELLKKFDKMKDTIADVMISQLRVSLKSTEESK